MFSIDEMICFFFTASDTSNSTTIYGVPSPPHSLAISSHTATYVTVSWQPPEFSHPHEVITYR